MRAPAQQEITPIALNPTQNIILIAFNKVHMCLFSKIIWIV